MMGGQPGARRKLRAADKVGALALIVVSIVLTVASVRGLSAGSNYLLVTVPFAVLMAFVLASTTFIVIRRLRAEDPRIFPPQPDAWVELLIINALGLPVLLVLLLTAVLLAVGQHSTLIGHAIGVGIALGVTVITRVTVRAMRQAHHFWRTNATYPATRREVKARLRQRQPRLS